MTQNSSLSRTAESLPGLESTADQRAVLDRFQIEVVNLVPSVSRMPTPAERQILQKRNADLQLALRPAHLSTTDMDKAQRAVMLMLDGYDSLRTLPFDQKMEKVQTYLLHLKELPLFAIIKACDDVTKGRAGRGALEWPPTTPVMCRLVRSKVEALQAEQYKIEQVLTAQRPWRMESTPEQQKRVAAAYEDFTRRMPTMQGVFDDEEKAATARRTKERNDRAILAEYEHLGLEPQYASDGILVSPALLRSLKNPEVQKADKRKSSTARRP